MIQFSAKFKIYQVIFLTLILTLPTFGQDDEDSYVDPGLGPEENEVIPEAARPGGGQGIEDMVRRMLKEMLKEMLQERDVALNRTLEGMQRQIQGIRNSVQSPPGGNNNNVPGRSNVQVNTDLIRQLEKQIKALKNHTLNPANPAVLQNTQAAPLLNTPTLLQTELHDLRYRLDTLNSSLGNQNLEQAEHLYGNLDNLTQSVKDLLETETEKKRQRIVRELLQAFGTSQNDLVKSLLNDLTNDHLLDKSMPEIVRGMFAGNIHNYPKIIALLKSAKRAQYKTGFSALIDLFHGHSNSSSSSSSGAQLTSGATLKYVDESQYLHLVYLAKKDFGTEFQPKFRKLVQNLVWKQKTCIRNLNTNNLLFVDREEGLKDGGYSVSSRRKSSAVASDGFCDWEIMPLGEGASFAIRQRNPGGFLNLNVLRTSVFAGTDAYNPSHLWKIQLRKNTEEVTFQSIPTSSDNPSYFLCSSKSGISSRRPVEVLLRGDGTSCSWFID